jgi:hypothetical protein
VWTDEIGDLRTLASNPAIYGYPDETYHDLLKTAKAGRDTGTIFEMGYLYRSNAVIVTVSFDKSPVNLMLAKSSSASVANLQDLDRFLRWMLPFISTGSGRQDIDKRFSTTSGFKLLREIY